MLYVCLLAYVAIVYIRPGEIIPGWVGFPFLNIASIVTLVAAVTSVVLRPRSLWDHPLDKCVVLFFAAVLLSNPANGWFGGAWFALQQFAPVVFCYFLIRLGIETPRGLNGVVVLLVVLTLFQASNGIVQHYTGVGLGNVTAYMGRTAEEQVQDDEEDADTRVRGTGIFNDPNDLAMSLVVAVPFLLTGLFGPAKRLPFRLVCLAATALLLLALYFTLSRGGMLALAAVFAHFALCRWGRWVALLIVILIVIGVGGLSSRLSNVSADEESAQGRVQAWSAGLQMFKEHPILGVGYGQYTEYHERVAHNSFVHSIAELGFVGGVAFVGLFYFLIRRPPMAVGVSEALRESAIGLLTALMFLSRQYNIVPFVVLALGATSSLQLTPAGEPMAGEDRSLREWANVAYVTLGSVVCVYVAVRLLAVWSH